MCLRVNVAFQAHVFRSTCRDTEQNVRVYAFTCVHQKVFVRNFIIDILCFLFQNDEEAQVMYTAIADYTAFETSELGFVQGDLVQVLRVGDGGWWFARLQRTSEEGWVPGSYLQEEHQDIMSA